MSIITTVMDPTAIIIRTGTRTITGDAVPRLDYLRDPRAIYERSFAIIEAEAEADLAQLPAHLRGVATRLIHSCGMTDIVHGLVWQSDPAAAGRCALVAGKPVLVDANMVRAGIIERQLPASNAILCTLGDVDGAPSVTTRSAAAVERWRPHLEGAVVAIGNAPTALFALLERLGEWPDRPAAIFAFPVGFVGAAESKEALIDAELGIPFLTLRGRRGGSAMAAACVNALASTR